MGLRFGVTAAGHVDTAAAAAALGVSRRTVQRWLHAHSGRSLAHLPTQRREQLLALLQPSQETVAVEAQQARYALKAIGGLHLPRKVGVLPSWERQRWLEDHVVTVLEVRVRQLRIRQVAITRCEPEKIADLKRRGRIVELVLVPTRFHATLVSHELLLHVGPWRFHASPEQVRQGFTTSWTVDAPRIKLAEVWGTVQAGLVTDRAGSTPS